MDTVSVILVALNQIVGQLIEVLPKLIIALIIWYLGKYFLNMAVSLISKFDLKHTKIDDKAIETLGLVVNGVGRVILVLIILDYLGIGRSVVSAVAQGITYAIAIALGLAFGKALEGDAKNVVESLRKFLRH